MHSNSYMRSPLLTRYKRKILGWPHPVQSPLLLSMNVSLTICLALILIAPADNKKIPYIIPYNYYDLWMVVAQNSSGQHFFDITPNARRVFVWKPYNASDIPMIFFEKYPKIIQDAIPTTTPGTLKGTTPTDIHGSSQSALEKIEKKVSTKHSAGIVSADTHLTAALEFSPPGKETSTKAVPTNLGMNMLHHSLKLAEPMDTLS